MNPPQRRLTLALGLSVFLHAILLSIHFKLPEAINRARLRALDVVLVNSKHATKQKKAQAMAQANLDGGGNTKEALRAKTPLPYTAKMPSPDELAVAQLRIKQLETQQREIMTAAGSSKAEIKRMPKPKPKVSEMSGRDLVSSALEMARMEAEIAREIAAYNQRPKRRFNRRTHTGIPLCPVC